MIVNYNELNLSTSSLNDLIFLKNKNLWLFLTKKHSYYFGGFYFDNGKAFKFLHSFNLPNFREITIISPSEIIGETENNQFFIGIRENEIEIKSIYSYPWIIFFDSNYLFNLNPFLRNLKIEKISSCLAKVDYFFENHNIFNILIESSCPLKVNESWLKVDLDLERERNSLIKEWWIFNGLETNTSYLKIKILREEKKNNTYLFNFFDSLILNFLLRRLDFLILENYLPAGFPWFFENWYRDELLSLFLLKDFLRNKKFFLSKYIYDLENKWNLNKEKGNEAVDTFLLILVNLEEEFFSYFNLLKKYLEEWRKKYFYKEYLEIPAKTTWMDTLERKSALEVLVLYFKILKIFNKKEKIYDQEIINLEKLIKKEISQFDDPNLPLVFFFAPEIYSKKEWENLFDQFLKFYFLDWGGITTTPKNKDNFHEIHTGENPLSYHSGDSWYFLNNLIAYGLNILNPEKYKKEIELIIKSSLIDLLNDGALGYSSELSSAKERKSEGCFIQTWSIAALIKLLSSFKNPDIFLEFLSD